MAKKLLIFFILLLIPLFSFGQVNDPFSVLKQYYEADKAENIDLLISLSDFSHVSSGELAQYKSDMRDTLTMLATAFDTKYFKITNEKVIESGSQAIIFYHLQSEIIDRKSETIKEDRDYAAVMSRSSGTWKVVYIQPKALFEQNNMMRDLTISAGTSLPEITDGGAGANASKTNWVLVDIFRVLCLLILIGGILLSIFYVRRNKDKSLKRKFFGALGIIIVILIIDAIIAAWAGSRFLR